jgi:hypothetical protein
MKNGNLYICHRAMEYALLTTYANTNHNSYYSFFEVNFYGGHSSWFFH